MLAEDLVAILDAGFCAEGRASLIISVPLPASVLVPGDKAEFTDRERTSSRGTPFFDPACQPGNASFCYVGAPASLAPRLAEQPVMH